MTPDAAMDRAAEVLARAEEQALFEPKAAEALVIVADGWRRLGQALGQQQANNMPRPPRPPARPSPASMPPRARR